MKPVGDMRHGMKGYLRERTGSDPAVGNEVTSVVSFV